MQLTILGQSGPFPTPYGATSGYFICAGKANLALDMGSGVLSRLTALTAPEDLSALLLTHWHYDHCSDVLPLLYRLEACAAAPLHIYAPADEASPMRRAVQASKAVILHDLQPGDEFGADGVRITAFAARHPVPALMYRLEHEGRVLCCTGDTNTTEGLEDFARGAHLLLADGLFPEADWDERKPHLSAAHVARLADQAGVQRFVITHLSPLYDPETLLKEARAVRRDALLAAERDTYRV